MKRIKWVLITILLLLAGTFWRTSANSGIPPTGFSGAGNEQTCTACHNSFNANSGKGNLLLSGIPREYRPGDSFNITITVQDPNASIWGFELTAVDSSGNRVGSFTITDNTNTDLRNGSGRDYVVNTIAGNFSGQTDMASWQVTWAAPAQNNPPVSFYATSVAGNRDRSPGGDYVYTNITSSSQFVQKPPTLNFVNPTHGPAAGGNSVMLGGQFYLPGVEVTFDGIDAQAQMLDGNTIMVTAPAHEMGSVDIRISNPDGMSSTFSKAYSYDPPPPPPPQIVLVSPDHGPTSGGQLTKVNGSNFVEGSQVIWDGKALETKFENINLLDVTTPLHDPGTIDISVVNPDGQSATLTSAYTYEGDVPPPIIKLTTPTATLSAGGATTQITWMIQSNGTPKQRLLLSTDNGATFPILLANNLNAKVNQFNWAIPEDLTAERARFRLEVTQGDTVVTDTSSKDFKIVRAPQILKVTPADVKVGNNRIDLVIEGQGFANGAIVELDGQKVKTPSVTSTQIKVKKAPHSQPGVHFLRVRNQNGGISRSFIFTVGQ